MNEEEVIEELREIHEEFAGWTQLQQQDKIKYMRDIIGPNMPQPLVNPYGEIIYGVNPADAAIMEWTLSQRLAWEQFCYDTWVPQQT